MTPPLKLHVGVKTDPVEYRYSYDWLFRLMAAEDIHHAQLGTFFELYQLPDDYFINLRQLAAGYGVTISGLFTTHRELGGFFRPEPGWAEVTDRNYRRLIEIGALLGCQTVGGNAGALLRDGMDYKPEGQRRYVAAKKNWLAYAYERGVPCLVVEPMSCLAEPPTLPDEIRAMADELVEFHQSHPQTAAIGYCVDVAHGYADAAGQVVWDNMQLFEAALPYARSIHLKNTDRLFDATFGFSEAERARGIVDIEAVRELLLARANSLPVRELVGYLEINGPKTGRDYSDGRLEEMLRQSLRYLRDTFRADR